MIQILNGWSCFYNTSNIKFMLFLQLTKKQNKTIKNQTNQISMK